MSAIMKCCHGMSGLDWRVTQDAQVEVRVTEVADSACGDEGQWQSYGNVLDVLDRVHDKAFEETEITHDRAAGVAGTSWAEGTRIGQTSEAVGMRLDPMRWRALAPNAIIHFQFGPGVTVATDGTQVIVFSFAKWGTDCAVVHRNNIRGPVTSTPIRTNEWDYVTNRPKTARSGADTQAKPSKSETTLRLVLAALLS